MRKKNNRGNLGDKSYKLKRMTRENDIKRKEEKNRERKE